MKILAGTDFSPNANDAVLAAAALAQRFNDRLQLVHATVPPYAEGETDPLWEPVVESLRDRMKSAVRQLPLPRGKVTGTVETGSPADIFARLGRPGHARMIVVSSVGRVALTRVLLGSTAERIAETARVPTLVVRNPAPLRAWAAGQRALRIFVAADFSLSSDAALAMAGELASHGPCELSAGYADDPEREAVRLGLEPEEDAAAGNPPGIGSALERDLREKVSAILGEQPVKLFVEADAGDPAATLIAMAQAAQADLLIVGTHHHHGISRLWHRSTSRSLLNDAPMGVLCVPSGGHGPAPMVVPTLSRVLVTTDFSEVGNRAVAAACALLPNGGTLRLLHVLSPKQSPLAGFLSLGRRPTLSPGELARLKLNARRKLGSLVPPVAHQRGVTVEVAVETADQVAETVLRQADSFGAQTICLSSHGRTGLAGAVFGSVAAEVVAGSQRPVHLVRLPAK